MQLQRHQHTSSMAPKMAAAKSTPAPQPPTAAVQRPAGQETHRTSISKVLGLLKYHAANTRGTSDRSQECKEALNVYNSLTDKAQRAAFLQEFDQNGAGKNASSLKFVASFKKRVLTENTTEISATENTMTRSCP